MNASLSDGYLLLFVDSAKIINAILPISNKEPAPKSVPIDKISPIKFELKPSPSFIWFLQ